MNLGGRQLSPSHPIKLVPLPSGPAPSMVLSPIQAIWDENFRVRPSSFLWPALTQAFSKSSKSCDHNIGQVHLLLPISFGPTTGVRVTILVLDAHSSAQAPGHFQSVALFLLLHSVHYYPRSPYCTLACICPLAADGRLLRDRGFLSILERGFPGSGSMYCDW